MRKISSFALAFAFMMPLAGCPGDDGGETDTVVGTTTMTPATEGTTMEPATETGVTTMEPATETGMTTADETTGGGGAGACGATCTMDMDCGTGTCGEDGFCDFPVVACDPAACPAPGACADVNGVSTCTTPCMDDTMCIAGTTACTGMDDAGNSICELIPCFGAAEGEPCEIMGFGQIGTCTGGLCTCTEDTECTGMNQACNPMP